MRINWYQKIPQGYNAMKGLETVGEEGPLDPLLKELVRIRVSQINGCAYCLDMHTKDALALGEAEQRIHLAATWREAPVFTPAEKAALAWAESLTLLSQNGAPDHLYADLQAHFNEEEILSLTFVTVAINSWNRFILAFKVDLRNYVSRKKSA